MSEFVSIPRMPKSVLVATDSLYEELASGPNTVDLLQGLDAMVIPFSAAPHFNEDAVFQLRDHLVQHGQLVKGSLLIKNPYDPDTFELADNAMAAFTDAKYHAMANVARLRSSPWKWCNG